MYILKNTSKEFVFTLAEKSTTLNAEYLFEFTNQTTGEIKYCVTQDLSNYKLRYNKFMFSDNTSLEIPLNGQLNFSPSGTWFYKVYEMPLLSPPSLDPSQSVGVVQEGILIVEGETTEVMFNVDSNKYNKTFDE